ncbi:unnamed protein product, partial [marine sediment metagenome]
MELVKHETCQQYLIRQLSEGWELLSLQGNKAVLLSPWGFKRELDLRNDVETLRPNAAGDETTLRYHLSAEDWGAPNPAKNWQCVDEVVPDETTTNVRSAIEKNTYDRDLYNIPDSGVSLGIINKITLHIRCRRSWEAYAKCSMRTNGVTYDGDEKGPIPLEWTDYSQEWLINPGNAHNWTWDEIDALQIGVSLKAGGVHDSRWGECTQVYVEVDYTIGPDTIRVSWTKGAGADKTMVRRKEDSYPTTPADGT